MLCSTLIAHAVATICAYAIMHLTRVLFHGRSGKTTLIKRYTTGDAFSDTYKASTGADLESKQVKVDGTAVMLDVRKA